MKSVWFALVVGLLAVGCGEGDDGDVEASQGGVTNTSGPSKQGTPPATKPNDELEETPAADQSAFGGTPSRATNGRVVECTNHDGLGGSSNTAFVLDPATGLVRSINVTINNGIHVDRNSIAISLRGPTTIPYTRAMTSENLLDGQTSSLLLPSGFSVPLGGSIQIVTTFGGGWSSDTSGECRIQL